VPIDPCKQTRHKSCFGQRTENRLTSSVQCCHTAQETKVLHEWVAHNRGEFEKTGCCGMEKITCHTGTIDAAWNAVEEFIPTHWLCEVQAVETCEFAYPSPAINHFKAETPALKN